MVRTITIYYVSMASSLRKNITYDYMRIYEFAWHYHIKNVYYIYMFEDPTKIQKKSINCVKPLLLWLGIPLLFVLKAGTLLKYFMFLDWIFCTNPIFFLLWISNRSEQCSKKKKEKEKGSALFIQWNLYYCSLGNNLHNITMNDEQQQHDSDPLLTPGELRQIVDNLPSRMKVYI